MEKLQQDMKNYCDGDDAKIELRPRGTGSDDMLPHHDMMLPHWQRFAKAVRGRTKVEEVKIYSVSLPRPVLDIILPTLQTLNLVGLTLFYTGLGNEGFQSLSSFVKGSTSLKDLAFGVDIIDDMSVADSISNAVHNHPSLEQIVFFNCGLNNTEILGKILDGCGKLKSLTLNFLSISCENLGPVGVNVIMDFIISNHPTLEVLKLQHNNISDSDLLLLASSLKKNTNLRQMNLRHNDITEEGEKTLLKAVFDPTSMDSIIESNHICIPYTYDISNASVLSQRPAVERELMYTNANEDFSVGQKIRKKVVLALCGVDGSLFDLSLFNDLSLPLMPRVLELIQEHSVTRRVASALVDTGQLEKDALSRLFRTLRGWELPLLFENLSPKKETIGKRKRRKTRH